VPRARAPLLFTHANTTRRDGRLRAS
jgi:hypothetical protein